MQIIDLRSDTVTQPNPEMRAAMASAEVGDDVYGDDPTVNRLEALAANMLGKEAALFAPSGTQTNLLGLLSHCARGDEYIVGQKAHTYQYEGGGAAVLGGIQPQPIDFESDGTLNLKKVKAVIKPDDFHFARTRLLCLENTVSGRALPLDYLSSATNFASQHNLKTHLDGARLFNAAIQSDVSPADIASGFDSVSICLSKGLGAPVGSLLCASAELIAAARRWRKMLGGGMRQAGILSAAGIYALENNIERLAQDHSNAARLVQGLSNIQALTIDPPAAQTNMVFIQADKQTKKQLTEFLKQRGILIQDVGIIRLVTHLDISEQDILTVIEAFQDFFNREQ